MKKLVVLVAALLTAGTSFADQQGVAPVNRFFVDSGGYVYFGTTLQFNGTCSYYIDHFRFNGATAAGKNMLATLIAAKIAGTSVTVWYTPSTLPGSNQSNGCNDSTLAVPTAIGIQ